MGIAKSGSTCGPGARRGIAILGDLSLLFLPQLPATAAARWVLRAVLNMGVTSHAYSALPPDLDATMLALAVGRYICAKSLFKSA